MTNDLALINVVRRAAGLPALPSDTHLDAAIREWQSRPPVMRDQGPGTLA